MDILTSPITRFYSGKSILITGATGFIGKVLIEKLLHSCPDVNKIYLLIRTSGGKNSKERLLEMIQQKPLNIRLKKELITSKLVPIESNLTYNDLGLTEENKQLLMNEVSIIFHVAASVKFEAPLEVNMRHNVVATKEMLDMACQFKQLACFVHVSTAYSNCQLLNIEERVYPMSVPEDPMSMEVTKELLDSRPNTYTFTKALAENVANQYADRINVVIVRPSIVMSSIREPAEGWVDTINGPVGLSVLGALGILQKIKVNSEVVFDLIPVDIVTNALLSIAWAATERRDEFIRSSVLEKESSANGACGLIEGKSNTVKAATALLSDISTKLSNNLNNIINNVNKRPQENEKEGEKKVLSSKNNNDTNNNNNLIDLAEVSNTEPDGKVCVFNLTTGSENPCSFYRYFHTGRQEAYEKPSTRALRPLLHIPKQKGMNPIQYWIHKIFSHLLFAYVMDFLLGLFGQKKMVVKAVNKMHHANEMFDYFCSNQWNFKTDNVKKLRRLQSTCDRQIFDCDVRQIDWDSYARLGWIGCRRFILKETDDSLGYARKRYLVVCSLYYTIKLLTFLAILYFANILIQSKLVVCMLMLPTFAMMYLL